MCGHAECGLGCDGAAQRRLSSAKAVIVRQRLSLACLLEGEQCLETTTKSIRARAGEGAIVAAGETMRMVGIGTGPRRSLVLILHDAEQPASTVVQDPPALQ